MTEAQSYFMALEKLFFEYLGAPLQLSPRDYSIAHGWHSKGIPLEFVEQTVRKLFARKKGGKIRSLAYCKRAVESAWRERQA